MVDSNGQCGPLVKDHYEGIINEIMETRGISYWVHRSGRHVINANTRFEEAVQHTEAFLARRLNTDPHFRYDYYAKTLRQHIQLGTRRIAHIDIGCGAGLLSWVLLDWATQEGFDHGRIDLYGLDHCPAMIDLASEIRIRMMRTIPMPYYPSLHYDYDADSFLRRLKMAWRPNTQYIITFGHVLVQTYNSSPSSIRDFARIIDHIMEIRGQYSTCEVIAGDATRGTWYNSFIESWEVLSDSLKRCYKSCQVGGPGPPTYASLNDLPPLFD